ncbi:MAG TPA: hypothetical protein VF731_11690 [Solirubrobacterales bacterium]
MSSWIQRAAARRPLHLLPALLLAVLAVAALGAARARAEVAIAGNGFYNVDVNNETGQYTVTTGPSHPLGEGLNVLFGGGTPGTSFDTLRSYTGGGTGNDYKLPSVPGSVTVPLGATGFRTTYTINENGDAFTVVQTVQVDGSGYEDSHVEVTTVITNSAVVSKTIGVRYLWDYQVNLDDGPTFRQDNPTGPVLLSEQEFPSPSFEYYTIEDNDVSPSPPTFDVLGTVTGPPGAAPVPPTLLTNASWAKSDSTDFEYTSSGSVVSVLGGEYNDNAVLYYWGDKESDAPVLAPGASYRVSASMFLTRAGEGLPRNPPPPAPPQPVVRITKGPPHETAQSAAVFDFTGTAGGSFECSLDNGKWKPCKSGENFGPVGPGDHLFRVREVLGGITSAPASYRWTVDLPRKCVLRVARARVFVFTKKSKARLVIHYTTYKPAEVTVGYSLKGGKGGLVLGSAAAKFKKAGVFRLPVSLAAPEMAKVRAAKSFKVKFKIPKTPALCGRFYTKRLTIPRKISGQTVWFQSDSQFAPGG